MAFRWYRWSCSINFSLVLAWFMAFRWPFPYGFSLLSWRFRCPFASQEDSNPDFFSRLKQRSERWRERLPKRMSSSLRRTWWRLRWQSDFYDEKDFKFPCKEIINFSAKPFRNPTQTLSQAY